MWHEARKQEKMIRGLIVDYRRRAERRKDFYEKIKAEPTQFLQLHGRECKIHLDPAIAAAGEGPAIMMSWQGDTQNLIDRFDVRAHLDFIPEIKYPDIPPEELSQEERQCNYERYRILAQNVFLGISEDKFLQQLAIEEQYGVTIEEKEMQRDKLHEKKGTGAAIGYNYNDPGAQPSSSHGSESKKVELNDSDEDSDLDIIDVDLSIDVNKMEAPQAHELNSVGPQFGMAGCDLFSFLTGDADDAEQHKQLLREEKEKAMYSGRKSRRERRAHRDRKLASRVVSPPHYAARGALPASPPAPPSPHSPRSPSPPLPQESIEFITSFGGDEGQPQSKPLYADKLKINLNKDPLYSEVLRSARQRLPRPPIGPQGPPRSNSGSNSRSNSRSRSRSRLRSISRSRIRSRSRSFRRSMSGSRSASPKPRSRSRSRSRLRSSSPYTRTRNYGRRSRSPQNTGYSKRRSRSMSYESTERVENKPSVPRYYGRRKDDKSSSELSLDSDSSAEPTTSNKSSVGNRSTNQNQIRSGTSSKGPSRETISLKEKLKRKMQAQLSRQLRLDQRAEAERLQRENRRQMRRDQEMRELAIKLRRRQREMRHQQNKRSSDSDTDRSHSRSSSRESNADRKREKSKSKSPSPQEKRIPIWENDKEFATVPYRPKPEDQNRRRYDNDYRDEKPHNQERPSYNSRYDRNYEENRPGNSAHSNKYEKHPRDNRFDNQYDNRWEHPPFPSQNSRRPFRGGYRGSYNRNSGPSRYGDGPSSYRQNEPERDSDSYNKNKVKLVDY